MKPIVLLGLFICVGCSAPTSPPASEQQFVDAYQSAFDNGQRHQLLGLVKWDGVSDDLRSFQEKMLTFLIGEHKIRSIQLVPIQSDQMSTRELRSLTFNIEPQFKLFVWHQGGSYYDGQPATGTVSAFVGVENGVYYICGVVSAEEQGGTPGETSPTTTSVGVNLSTVPDVNIKRIDGGKRKMSLKADGTLHCHGSLLEILRFIYQSPQPRFRDEALPTGMYSVSLPGKFSVPDEFIGVTSEVRAHAWTNLVRAYEDTFRVGISSIRRDEDAYLLVAKNDGEPQLSKVRSSENPGYGTGGIGLRFTAYSMDDLAAWLERDRIVLNATGMNGRYNFELPLSPFSDGVDVDVHKVIAALRTIGLDFRRGRDKVNVILIQKSTNSTRADDLNFQAERNLRADQN